MDALKNSYLNALAAHGDAVDNLLDWHRAGGADAETYLRRVARTLRGTASTFGYPEISHAAAALALCPPDALETCAKRLLDLIRERSMTEHASPLAVAVATACSQTRAAMVEGLNEQVAVHGATSVQSMLRVVERESVSVVLLDAALAGAREALLTLRTSFAAAHLDIFVVTTGPAGELYALGADGVFTPDATANLALAVAGRLRRRQRSVEALVNDPLTGLPNRGVLEEAFRQATGQARRSGAPLALAVLDFDRFKLINDSYGHVMGDQVLRRASQVIRRRLRSSDVLVRWGGEELVALLPDTELEPARKALEDALAQVRTEVFDAPDGRSFSATFSAGVVQVSPRSTIEEALARADERLYLAKASGRARVVMSGQEIPRRRLKILLVEDDLVLGRLVSARLKAVDAEVTQALSIEEGRQLIMTHGYDLILLDVELPDGNGLALLVELRREPRSAATPVLVLTGRTDTRTPAAAFELGANDYMTKPTQTRELLARIARLVNIDPQTSDETQREGRRVLIGDENPRIRNLVGLTLRTSSRWTVTEARTGAETLAMAAMEPFDLVVLDMAMPDLDGATTLARLRRLPGHAKTPVVLLSEKTDLELRARLADLDVSDVVPKPCDPIALRQRLEALTARAAEASPREAPAA